MTENTNNIDLTVSGSIGKQFVNARAEKNLSLAAVSSDIRIRPEILEKIEADRFSEIYTPTYVKGYIRNYAKYLGLDGERLVEKYIANHLPEYEAEWMVESGKNNASGNPNSRKLVFLLATAAIVLGLLALFGMRLKDNSSAELATSTDTEELAQDQETLIRLDESNNSLSLPDGNASTGETASSELPNTDAAENPDALTAPEPASTAIEQAPVAEPEPVESNPAELLVVVNSKSWVQVIDQSGEALVSGELAAGDVKTYTGALPYDIALGNATSVELYLGGVQVNLEPHIKSNKTARFKTDANPQ